MVEGRCLPYLTLGSVSSGMDGIGVLKNVIVVFLGFLTS